MRFLDLEDLCPSTRPLTSRSPEPERLSLATEVFPVHEVRLDRDKHKTELLSKCLRRFVDLRRAQSAIVRDSINLAREAAITC